MVKDVHSTVFDYRHFHVYLYSEAPFRISKCATLQSECSIKIFMPVRPWLQDGVGTI